MRSFNKVVLEGAVGSHFIELGKDGLWRGQFDLHVAVKDQGVIVFDCLADEKDMSVHNLGTGIGGNDARVEGEIRRNKYSGTWYIHVTKIEIL